MVFSFVAFVAFGSGSQRRSVVEDEPVPHSAFCFWR
jgi:hypothetical protein